MGKSIDDDMPGLDLCDTLDTIAVSVRTRLGAKKFTAALAVTDEQLPGGSYEVRGSLLANLSHIKCLSEDLGVDPDDLASVALWHGKTIEVDADDFELAEDACEKWDYVDTEGMNLALEGKIDDKNPKVSYKYLLAAVAVALAEEGLL